MLVPGKLYRLTDRAAKFHLNHTLCGYPPPHTNFTYYHMTKNDTIMFLGKHPETSLLYFLCPDSKVYYDTTVFDGIAWNNVAEVYEELKDAVTT